MTVRVFIGDSDRELKDTKKEWIIQQIGRHKEAHESVCVRVHIEHPDMSFWLSSPGCKKPGKAFEPSRKEKAVIDLWEECRLSSESFSGEDVFSFLEGLRNLL